MVAQLLKANTSAGFDVLGAGGSVGLTIENDPGESGGLDIHLLLFPAVGATLRCDIGTVSPLGTPKMVDVPGGIITMSGTSATLPKRTDGENPVIQVMMAFAKNGAPISPTITQLTDLQTFVSNVECTAAISYTPYKTMALPFTYTPEQTLGVGAGAGSISTFGTIVAFYPPDNITTFDVNAFQLSNGFSFFEMYRITSPSMTNNNPEERQFERPPNYPSSGVYPGKAFVLEVGPFTVETDRVHEIGSMTSTGAVKVDRFFVPKLHPYIGDVAYKMPKFFKPSTLPTELFPEDIIKKAQNEIKRRGQGKL